MSDQPIRWRYGFRLARGGKWLWPRSCWEYDVETAKRAAVRTFPHAMMIGVEPTPPAQGERWFRERDEAHNSTGWHLEAPPPAPASSADRIDPDQIWWNRDD